MRRVSFVGGFFDGTAPDIGFTPCFERIWDPYNCLIFINLTTFFYGLS
jgi:hypothetical protein